MTKQITSNQFTANIKNGNTAIIADYAKQLGIDADVLADIAKQLVTLKNAKLTVRKQTKDAFGNSRDGYKNAYVSFDTVIWGWYERVTITWCFNANGVCYSVLNGCFCK